MDPSERVSQEAARIELETTQELLREGVFQRVNSAYKRGSFLQCIFDPLRCEYLLTLHHTREGKKFAVSVALDEETFLKRSEKLDTWRITLRGLGLSLEAKLRAEMRQAGLNVSVPPEPAEPGKTYEARGTGRGPLAQDVINVYEMGKSTPTKILNGIGWADEAADFVTEGDYDRIRLQGEMIMKEEEEEREAIESIKRTLAERSAEEQ